MLLFSTSNTLYYIPLLPHPIQYFRRFVVALYIPGSEDWLKDLLLAIAPYFFGLIFMTTFFLEALHFVYRYLIICRLLEPLVVYPHHIFRGEWQSLLTVKNLLKFLVIAYPSYLVLHFLNFFYLVKADESAYSGVEFVEKSSHALIFLFVVMLISMLRLTSWYF